MFIRRGGISHLTAYLPPLSSLLWRLLDGKHSIDALLDRQRLGCAAVLLTPMCASVCRSAQSAPSTSSGIHTTRMRCEGANCQIAQHIEGLPTDREALFGIASSAISIVVPLSPPPALIASFFSSEIERKEKQHLIALCPSVHVRAPPACLPTTHCPFPLRCPTPTTATVRPVPSQTLQLSYSSSILSVAVLSLSVKY